MNKSPNIDGPRSIWSLGVPISFRDQVSAAFPQLEISYPSVLVRSETDSYLSIHDALHARICGADKPVVFIWHEIDLPEAEISKLTAKGIPVARLRPAKVEGPISQLPRAPVSYGITLEWLDIIGGFWSPPVDVAACLQKYRAGNVTAVNYGRQGADIPASLEGKAGKRMVLVVADDAFHDRRPDEARLIDYADLAERARLEHPKARIVFITNYEVFPAEANEALRAALEGLGAACDVICETHWRPEYAELCDAVYARSSAAAFDALIRDRQVFSSLDPELMKAASAKTLQESYFAARYLNGTVYVDPVHSQSLDPNDLFDVLAARMDLAAAPTGAFSTGWSRLAEVEWREGTSEAKTAPSSIRIAGENGASLNALNGRLALLAPDWLQPMQRLQPQPDSFAVLQSDLNKLALLMRGAGAYDIASVALHPFHDVDAVSIFAEQQPELFLSLATEYLRVLGCRQAFVGDLDDPAVRLFSRACRNLGVTRCFIPLVSMNPSSRPLLQSLERAHGMSDCAFVWTQEQSDALMEAGYPLDRVIPFDHAPVQDFTNKAVFWLCADVMLKPRECDALKASIEQITELMLLMEIPVHFVLGQSFLAGVSGAFVSFFQDNPHVSYSLVGVDPMLGQAALKGAGLVISADRHGLLFGDQQGATVVDMRPALADGAFDALLDEVSGAIEDLVPRPRDWPKRRKAPARLADVLPAGQQITPVDFVAELISGQHASIPAAASAIGESYLQKQHQHVMSMLGIGLHESMSAIPEPSALMDADIVLRWGARGRRKQTVASALSKMARALKIPELTLEDGFVRSVGLGVKEAATLSVVLDDKTAFYDATRPSRLETILNGPLKLTKPQVKRVRTLVRKLVSEQVSKYNFALPAAFEQTERRKTVLVVDQRRGDLSIELGLADRDSFKKMVEAALALGDDYDIIIKTHPDAAQGGRVGAISCELLSSLQELPNVSIITEAVNPYSLIGIADEVFVVTSGMGFEALMAGKPVRCFGVPFYAGWGLTRDEIELPRRQASRSVDEIFHVFYLQLSRYFDPRRQTVCELETLIDYIIATRPEQVVQRISGAPVKAEHSEESARETEAPVTPSLVVDVPSQAHDPKQMRSVWALGMDANMSDLCQKIFSESAITFLPTGNRKIEFSKVLKSPRPAVVVPEGLVIPGLMMVAQSHALPVFRVGEGFVRFVGAGGMNTSSWSFTLDSRGRLNDASVPTDLEVLLQTYDFAGDQALMKQAREVRELLAETGISQHNPPLLWVDDPYGTKTKRRVLVLGSAASESLSDDSDLVELALAEQPEAQVIYRPHPLCHVDVGTIRDLCEVQPHAITLKNALVGVDRVYVEQSLAGFEAVLHGVPATVTGTPFYAGWGITDDRLTFPTRTKRLNKTQVFAGAYLLYAKYLDPQTGLATDLKTVIETLAQHQRIERLAAF